MIKSSTLVCLLWLMASVSASPVGYPVVLAEKAISGSGTAASLGAFGSTAMVPRIFHPAFAAKEEEPSLDDLKGSKAKGVKWDKEPGIGELDTSRKEKEGISVVLT
ncbi:hypothetical protein FB451DRAFT_1274834 [Mycena latifolia]|nr:hypothetical protein FB451DRAFT_1274834 [Mycena latifolia]